MGLKVARTLYSITLIACHAIAFVLLIPRVIEWLHSFCWRTYQSKRCTHIVGLQAAYRLSTGNIFFHMILSIATIEVKLCSRLASSMHLHFWFLKIPLYFIANVVVFIVPLNEASFSVLYYVHLSGGIMFIIIMFLLTLDFSHGWKILWMRNAHRRSDEPTCYVCTWLFVIHFVTSLLYAAAFDIILAFFFFNTLSSCIITLSFMTINILLCLIAVALSHHPTLHEMKATSQIIVSSLLFFVSFVTWLALSDPENEYCNMFGTAFSGSMQNIPYNFRTILCSLLAVLCLIYLSLRNDTISFTDSLIYNERPINEMGRFSFSKYHLTLAFCSCYLLMAITNWYSPIHENTVEWDSGTITALLDLEEYNWVRFIALCVTSSLLPVIYIALLTYRICHQYITTSPSKHRIQGKGQMDDSNASISIEISLENAIHKLKLGQPMSSRLTKPSSSAEYTIVPCFFITQQRLYFWHFPRNICQSYHGGRNGSNACTVIALIIGRLFSRSDISMPFSGNLSSTWIDLYTTSIVEGNALYDSICKEFGVLDLSIEEAAEHFSTKLNIKQIGNPLAVCFESDIETVTIAYQLKNFVSLYEKQVILFIHRFRTGSFLIYPDGYVLFSDSHSYGDEGSLLVLAASQDVDSLVGFLKHVLGSNQNKLATLTKINYEDRSNILKHNLLKRTINTK